MFEQKCSDEDIIKAINHYHQEHGWAPSIREIGAAVGLRSSQSIHQRLVKLADEERIVYQGVRQIKVV